MENLFKGFKKHINGKVTITIGKRKARGSWINSDSILNINNVKQNKEQKEIMLWEVEEGWKNILPNTLCRYSGIVDYNGNEICEHDILEWINQEGEKRYGEVKFINGCFVFVSEGKENDVFLLRDIDCLEAVIVSNSFERPELLKRRKFNGSIQVRKL